MKRKQIVLIALVAAFAAWHLADRFMLARGIAPPDATLTQVLRVAVRIDVEVASPHRNLFQDIEEALVPSVVCARLKTDARGEF